MALTLVSMIAAARAGAREVASAEAARLSSAERSLS
jgi:hypothetical protein